jgi:hypothetical protein
VNSKILRKITILPHVQLFAMSFLCDVKRLQLFTVNISQQTSAKKEFTTEKLIFTTEIHWKINYQHERIYTFNPKEVREHIGELLAFILVKNLVS